MNSGQGSPLSPLSILSRLIIMVSQLRTPKRVENKTICSWYHVKKVCAHAACAYETSSYCQLIEFVNKYCILRGPCMQLHSRFSLN